MDKPAHHPHALRYADWNHSRYIFNRILVIVDPTAVAQPAMEKAARLAANSGGSLELYICDDEQSPPESWAGESRSGEYRELIRQRHMENLDRLARQLRSKGLAVTTAYDWHAPLHEGIGHHVIRTMPDLVVKETHPHGAMPSTFSRTDWLLIRVLPAPLLLVRRNAWPDQPHVSVGVDPLQPAHRPVTLDEALLQMTHSIGEALKARLEVVHVLESPRHLPGEPVSDQTRAQVHAIARKSVEHLAEAAALPVVFAEGRVSEQLCAYARRCQPAVLVIGAAARPHVAHSTAAGTAARILENVVCDVLVVKPPGFVSPLLVSDD